MEKIAAFADFAMRHFLQRFVLLKPCFMSMGGFFEMIKYVSDFVENAKMIHLKCLRIFPGVQHFSSWFCDIYN